MVNCVGAINVSVRFNAKDAVLRVVLPIILNRPQTFSVSSWGNVTVVLARAFPTITQRIRVRGLLRFSFQGRPIVLVRFRAPSKVGVKQAPRRVNFTVIISGGVKILRIVGSNKYDFPFTTLKVIKVRGAREAQEVANSVGR